MVEPERSREVIAAVATPPGKGGIGVIRLSGARLENFAVALSGARCRPRMASYRKFLDSRGSVIDEGMLLFFPAPHSYTGEDVLEVQGHGGPVVMRMLLERCLELGARLAEPGEFSKRAFLNGKLDLAQAEAVADLIDASTTASVRSAMRSLQGEFSASVTAMVGQLVELRALIEATLDFPEEELELPARQDIADRLRGLQSRLEVALAGGRQGRLLRAGIQVALVGRPNVGKSSLLNRLARDEVAIVTDVPGTTRDALHQSIVLDGVPINLTDTAGLREAIDPVERLGVARSWQNAERADLLLFVVDGSEGIKPEDRELLERLPAETARIVVINKADLMSGHPDIEKLPGTVCLVSALTGEGLAELEAALLKEAGWEGAAEGVILARERHIQALGKAREHVCTSGSMLESLELVAEELRQAQIALAGITGEFTADDLLGEIFSRFCIGK